MLKELTAQSGKINTERTRLADRRPSETFSFGCAGQTKKSNSDHAKGKRDRRYRHSDSVLNFQVP